MWTEINNAVSKSCQTYNAYNHILPGPNNISPQNQMRRSMF